MPHNRPASKKTKRLILHWVNLPDSLKKSWPEIMLRGHPDVFESFAHDKGKVRETIEKVRVLLQLAWRAPDMRLREWRLFIARQEYSRAFLGGLPAGWYKKLMQSAGESLQPFLNINKLLLVAPPLQHTGFDQIGSYAQRMAVCEGPGCEEPFFLRGPKRERYCPECKDGARKRRRKRYYDSKERFNRKEGSRTLAKPRTERS